MSDELFQQLVESAKEAVVISKGEAKPSRTFVRNSANVASSGNSNSAPKTKKEFPQMVVAPSF